MSLAPVRKMIHAGLPIALGSDFNPGSSPSGNMQLILSMGSIMYRMNPAEAINAVTINSAYAMGVENELGSITIGKKANLFITSEMPSIEFLPYAYGSNKVQTVILNGKIL
jgi:imidazolonepropionase